jgi:hypothetical protein
MLRRLTAMPALAIQTQNDIETLRVTDRERAASYARTQPPISKDEWQVQVRLFEQAGRDTASALPFWRRWLWKKT